MSNMVEISNWNFLELIIEIIKNIFTIIGIYRLGRLGI